MYKLTTSNKSGYDIIFKILKVVIICMFIYWLYNHIRIKIDIENFEENSNNQNSLHDILTANCDPKYCNTTSWGDKVKLPDNHVLTNFSTANGCCTVPKEFNDLVTNRFNNEHDVQDNYKKVGFYNIINP